ncbi:MAG TPA: gluconate 2-dehydrogenase subunit 3 family protein [Gammaproteobacteria bacterium]|nr:gluconate 2-dehydrogenase subunit 3 family protein [Gammaproteobacteria bacterium]
MPERYPGYDVLAKRDSPSWNEPTRRVIAERLAIADEPHFFTTAEWRTLTAICARIVPQPPTRTPVPIAAMVDRKLTRDARDGYRQASLPPLREAWRRGLAALDAAARERHETEFHVLPTSKQDALLKAMQQGELTGPEWGGMPADTFFNERLAHDILAAYYSHPTAWNEIGFGGPASPRGYVRMKANRRDPWEGVEATPGREAEARRKNERVG